MSVWISREWNEGGKRRREKVEPGMKGVREQDQFVVEWIDPQGRRRRKKINGKGRPGKRLAEELAQQISSELTLGTYKRIAEAQWADFRQWYDQHVWSTIQSERTKKEVKHILDRFERIAKPRKMKGVSATMLTEYRTRRLKDPGKKRRASLSVATANKEIRTITGVLGLAKTNGWIESVPKIKPLRERHILKPFVTVEHFELIYGACSSAWLPDGLPISAADWWRALLVTLFGTGQRIGAVLQLQWQDVHLKDDPPWLLWRAATTKGGRDHIVKLEEEVVSHLQGIRGNDTLAFPWVHDRTTLEKQFWAIQQAAGIHLPCYLQQDHEHTLACFVYGFHAFRRSYATHNSVAMDLDELQNQMGHQSPTTTQAYRDYAKKMSRRGTKSFMPDFLRKKKGSG